MNDGGALLTKEQMLERLRQMAQTSPIVAQGLELQRIAEMSDEEMALAMAIAALTALSATQQQLRQALVRQRPVYYDRRRTDQPGDDR